MNLQQAQARAAELTSKIQAGESLTLEEQTELTNCQGIIAVAVQATRLSEADIEKKLRAKGVLPSKGILKNPAFVLTGKVVGVLVLMGVSAFGGMKYEERRYSKRTRDSFGGLGDHGVASGHFLSSPQSHPATSMDDGRLAANRPDSMAHTTPARARATANT